MAKNLDYLGFNVSGVHHGYLHSDHTLLLERSSRYDFPEVVGAVKVRIGVADVNVNRELADVVGD